uniref:Uncharacterized protein n=1 Tax=Anguilla anguilla TaxID=7936 RepID=A0A0E9V5K4_ANGAN
MSTSHNSEWKFCRNPHSSSDMK